MPEQSSDGPLTTRESVHALTPELWEALRYFHAVWYEVTDLDPVTVDLCRLKSAFLHDCNW